MNNNFNNLENVLQEINRTYMLPPEEDIKQSNYVLQSVLKLFLDELREDALFNQLFSRVFYGGSYYDDVKVGKFDEFDLDFVLKLDAAEPKVVTTEVHGFVACHVKNPNAIRGLRCMIDKNGFLKSSEVRQWMENLMTVAMHNLCPFGVLVIGYETFEVNMHKSGPAMTVQVSTYDVKISIDFVPCFEFSEDQWPTINYRHNPVSSKTTFFLIPKKPTNENLPCDGNILWSLSFQQQERILIARKGFLKPTLRLLKQLRDNLKHNHIASYYIKTIFLWEVTSPKSVFADPQTSLATAFLTMLDKYSRCMKNGIIPDFWNRNHNLLELRSDTSTNIGNCLKNIFTVVSNNLNNPLIVCHYLGTPIDPLKPRPITYPLNICRPITYVNRNFDNRLYKWNGKFGY